MSDRAEPINLGAFWEMPYIHQPHTSSNIGNSEENLGERSDSFYKCAINGAEMIWI